MTPPPMTLRLYNTRGRAVEPFRPADPAHISFYTCGPTVYDDAHIGNFRSFLAADVLRRWLESPLCELEGDEGLPPEMRQRIRTRGRTVTQVMNITDVGHMTDDAAADGGGEDKMALAAARLAEAKKAGTIPEGAAVDPRDPFAVARFFEARFKEDALALGLRVARDDAARPDSGFMPRATDNIGGMIRFIAALVERGCAYVAGGPGRRAVYFDVNAFPSYGLLSGNTLEALRGGAGGRVTGENQRQKRHPADFLLWKEDPTHLMRWPSPWGEGYPGWHIECSVMALDRLVPPSGGRSGLDRVLASPSPDMAIDLHSGGEDNIFPHHECERAQSCCVLGGGDFARCWFHSRFLMVDGAKMSKSRGTMYTPRQLFAMGHEPAAVRLELIKAHYRSNADFSMQGLRDSAKMVERWRAFVAAGRAGGGGGVALHEPVRLDFARALDNDLNIAEAIGVVNRWMNGVPTPGPAEAETFAAFDTVFGVLDLPRLEAKSDGRAVYLPGTTPSDAVAALLDRRAEAKKAKDFPAADAIRDELKAMGYAIKDIPGGKVEVGPA